MLMKTIATCIDNNKHNKHNRYKRKPGLAVEQLSID